MALINCPNCGARISDKARKCPKCGVDPKQRIEEKQIADEPNAVEADSTQQNPQDPEESAEPSSRKPWWIAFSIIVIIIVGSIFVSLQTQQNNQATLTEEVEKENVVEITPAFIEAVHQYDELYPFSEGLAAVMKDGKFGYINTKGELVIPCKFEYAGDFIDSTAVVVVDDEKPYFQNHICILNHDGQIIETSYEFYGYGSAPYFRLDSDRFREYVGVYTLFDVGVSGSNENDGVIHYLDKNLKEVAQPSDSLLRNFDTDKKYERFVEQLQQTDIYGRTEHKVGIKDKEGKIIIPAKYDRILDIGENGVAVALLYFESAKSYVWEYRYGEGLSIYGYVDLTTGKSTFTDADFAKMEGYRQAQEEAYPGLKQQKEAEEAEEAELEQQQEQEEQKCPEWLQGNWRCQTQYGEARVGISGDIISVWFDGEHFYTGSFEVRNNELVYDRRNGSAYTLQFDRRRKCLMMDDNHPMSRF